MLRRLAARGTVAGPTAQPASIALAAARLVSVRARRIVPEHWSSTRVGGCVSTTRPRRASGAMSWPCVLETRRGETSHARATQARTARRGRALARRRHLPLPLAEAARGQLATRDARPGQRGRLDARLAALHGFRSSGGVNKVQHVALHLYSDHARGGEGRGHGWRRGSRGSMRKILSVQARAREADAKLFSFFRDACGDASLRPALRVRASAFRGSAAAGGRRRFGRGTRAECAR